MLATTLPSDAVRIKTISPLILPLADSPSATVEAVVQLDFRFGTQKGKGWQVTDVRSGGREWFSVERLFAAVNEEKRKSALTDLNAVSEALEKYRAVRGSYVISDRHEVLIDHLAPRFLSQIIRLDPWHHSYHYQGEGARFTLRSVGPDGKPNTPDDVTFSRP
jgi:hypothetical protein